jgi:hypothetical protein
MNIKNVIKKETIATINYPEIDGFKVTLRYLGKKELKNIFDECTTKMVDPKTREVKERINKEKFANIIAEKVVIKWEGLTLKGLSKLVPVEITPKMKMDEVVEPTFDNKQALLENSADFDSWITDTTRELANFNEEAQVKEYENLK